MSVVTVAKLQDRIPVDMTIEQAAEIHGPGNVYLDGVCYAEILKANTPAAVEASEIVAEAKTKKKSKGDSDE